MLQVAVFAYKVTDNCAFIANFACKFDTMNTIFPNNDTICAPATAAGGAIAMVRISGPRAVEVADAIFSRNILEAPGYSLHYGEIPELDDVMVSVFRGPKSYTGEDSVEICCHGSSYIVGEVLHRLEGQGCRMARPGEFTQRAFLHGRMDLTQAEAVADVIASNNAATHRLAMSQMRGGITRALAAMRSELLKLTSLLELELDFSDHEDLEFADRTELSAITQELIAQITRLTESFRVGSAIKNGIPVAIVGAPNVGKSTLLNALLQEDRAIVSDIQGTTRDVIEDTVAIGAHTFRFIDTAGIRHTDDTIERLGIERSRRAAERAQIVIMLSEPNVDYPEVNLREDQIVIRIINKTDEFQALHGVGLDSLREQLCSEAARLSATDTDIILTNARHHAALTAALVALQRVASALSDGISGDLIAQDLREVLFRLAEVTGGEITSDEVLGNIFSHFCIGK